MKPVFTQEYRRYRGQYGTLVQVFKTLLTSRNQSAILIAFAALTPHIQELL